MGDTTTPATRPVAPRRVRVMRSLTLWGTVLGGVPALGWSFVAVVSDPHWTLLFSLVAMGVVAEVLRVRIYRAHSETFSFSLAVAVTMAAATASGEIAPLVAVSAAAVHLVANRTRRPDKVLFNLGISAMAAGMATVVFWMVTLPGHGTILDLIASILAAATYVVVNVGLVSAMISLHAGRSFPSVVRDTGWFVPTNLLLGLTGAFIGVSYQGLGAIGAVVFVLPILVMRFTLAFYAARSEETIRTLEEQATHLDRLARFDTLTGLPNRRHLRETMGVELGDDGPVALLLVELNRFREINDTFGHQHGDRLLQQVGPRLREVAGARATVARLGGDEFAVLLPGATLADAEALAERLIVAGRNSYTVEGHEIEVSASIGMAVAPEHGIEPGVLLRRAEIAMYVAKAPGRGHVVYSPDQEESHSAERLAMIGELRRAIDEGSLSLQYQPQVDCQTGLVSGAEALVRWHHPERGTIQPDDFIPLAERTGLIRPLTRWVMETAVRQCHAWQQAGLDLKIAVNLSMRDLDDPDFPDYVTALLGRWGLSYGTLSVEITESALMAEPEQVIRALARLRGLGLSIAVDDFGVGYSSLSYLKTLPVDVLKVDRSFTREMVEDKRSAAIVRSTISLAHDLGLSVMAEGVEDLAGWELLGALACDGAQGYYLSRPLPADEFATWVRASTALRVA